MVFLCLMGGLALATVLICAHSSMRVSQQILDAQDAAFDAPTRPWPRKDRLLQGNIADEIVRQTKATLELHVLYHSRERAMGSVVSPVFEQQAEKILTLIAAYEALGRGDARVEVSKANELLVTFRRHG